MQARLSEVAAERDQILAEIDTRVQQKEEELRQALLAEITAERCVGCHDEANSPGFDYDADLRRASCQDMGRELTEATDGGGL